MLQQTDRITSSRANGAYSAGCLAEFLNHLKSSGVSKGLVPIFRASARHFLVWLERDGGRLDGIDDAVLRRFRHHDCRCPRSKHTRYRNHARRSRQSMYGVLKLVRFLEDTGRTFHLGELDKGFRLLGDFLERRAAVGHSADSLKRGRINCRHFLVWLHQSRTPMAEMDNKVVDRFLDHDCLCPDFPSLSQCRDRARYVIPIKAFTKFLTARGVAPDVFPVRRDRGGEELVAFRDWLRRHRGISEATIRNHVREIRALLADLGDDPGRYDATLIRDVLLRRFVTVSRPHAKSIATSMRMYLRFLATSSGCPPGLVGAVPKAPGWRLSELPRYISIDDVERVIGSCDTATPAGLRDRAMLLLLARLALRAGDVTNLRLGDVDWKNARLSVCGKSGREVALPLPQDVGDGLLDYIELTRPRLDEARVFLTVHAPHRPFASSAAIAQIVRRALGRAGVDNAHPRGASLMRHSAATAMLRSGASLEAIGTLLRHRSPDTTAIYAKVNLPMLLSVAQPWIGDAR